MNPNWCVQEKSPADSSVLQVMLFPWALGLVSALTAAAEILLGAEQDYISHQPQTKQEEA